MKPCALVWSSAPICSNTFWQTCTAPPILCGSGDCPLHLSPAIQHTLRPLAGIIPPGGAHLHIYAADLARGPDGQWWVLRDRTQAPSGIGYALENRLAVRHGIPEIHRDSRASCATRRFSGTCRHRWRDLSRHEDARVCVLTPGPMNETYFEHAYLARYLGFLLVEGEDLTVRDNGVFIRTVSGLRRARMFCCAGSMATSSTRSGIMPDRGLAFLALRKPSATARW